jgi:hypothetical protein
VTPFKVWFGREPPTWLAFSESRDRQERPLFRSHASINRSDKEEGGEDREGAKEAFAKEGANLEEAREAFVLSELSARVSKYTKLVNKRIVKKKGAFAVEYALQETATLLIPVKLKFLAEVRRILVQVLEKLLKV